MTENKDKRETTVIRVYQDSLESVDKLYATLMLRGEKMTKQDIHEKAIQSYCKGQMTRLAKANEQKQN